MIQEGLLFVIVMDVLTTSAKIVVWEALLLFLAKVVENFVSGVDNSPSQGCMYFHANDLKTT